MVRQMPDRQIEVGYINEIDEIFEDFIITSQLKPGNGRVVSKLLQVDNYHLCWDF